MTTGTETKNENLQCQICGNKINLQDQGGIQGIKLKDKTYYFCKTHSYKEIFKWVDETILCRRSSKLHKFLKEKCSICSSELSDKIKHVTANVRVGTMDENMNITSSKNLDPQTFYFCDKHTDKEIYEWIEANKSRLAQEAFNRFRGNNNEGRYL